jgi:hypothetical protein
MVVQVSQASMRAIVGLVFLGFLFATGKMVFGQAVPTGSRAVSYDILGLKLGMTAREAEADLQQQLKILPAPAPDGYPVDVTPKRYQRQGTFVDEVVISNSQLELILTFAEVYPGKGTGPESLYRIMYTPKPLSGPDKQDFVDRALAKFGPPTLVVNATTDLWADRPFRTEREALLAGVPVLELDTETPRLKLVNESIRRKMEDAYHATQKLPL